MLPKKSLEPSTNGLNVDLQDVVDIVANIAVAPRLEILAKSDLVADLGFDSIQFLELIGELEHRTRLNLVPMIEGIDDLRSAEKIYRLIQRAMSNRPA